MTRELGRLARWMRILGFDAAYFDSGNTATLIIQALQQDRVIVTKNRRLGEHRGMQVVILKSDLFKEQIKELSAKLALPIDKNKIFTRCIICNEELEPVEKIAVKDKVPEYVFRIQEKFIACPACQRIYWQGTHWGNVEEVIKKLH